MGCWLTCYSLSMPGTLSTGNEDNIALRCSNVVALQEKELIDTVILKGRDLDNGSDWAGEALLDDKILFALDLQRQNTESMKLAGELALPQEGLHRSPYLLQRGGIADLFGLCP